MEIKYNSNDLGCIKLDRRLAYLDGSLIVLGASCLRPQPLSLGMNWVNDDLDE
jgi:hypothetical protein